MAGYLPLRQLRRQDRAVPLDADGHPHRRALRPLDGLKAQGRHAEIHLHHPDHPEPDRQHHAAGAPRAAAGAGPRAWRADLRGRVLRRPDLGAASGKAPPALYSLDPAQVIHIGSFSKTLAPALRSAMPSRTGRCCRALVALKTDAGTGALEQMVVAEYFSKHFDSHVAALSGVLKEKLRHDGRGGRARVRHRGRSLVPKGGIFLWMKLPDQVDVRKLVQAGAEGGIAFNPGPEWAVDGEAPNRGCGSASG